MVNQFLQLFQELKGHRGHVNSVCVDCSGEVVYSGDSVGDVRVWSREESGVYNVACVLCSV